MNSQLISVSTVADGMARVMRGRGLIQRDAAQVRYCWAFNPSPRFPQPTLPLFTAIICLVATLLCPVAFGLSPDQSITQFHHTVWTAKDGAPAVILSIAQTPDGYLWLGSLSGLFRFDGVRFEQYRPQSGGDLPSNEVASLLALANGDLWIGYRPGGASLLRNGQLTNYGEREGLPSGGLAAFAQDQSGTIWAAVHSGGLFRLEGGRWQRLGSDWNFPGHSAQTIFVDRHGTLWVATEDTVVFLPRGAKSFQPTGEHITIVCRLLEAPDGKVWIAETTRNVRPLRFPDRHAPVPEVRAGSQAILFDDAGALWATSVGDGIAWVARPQELRPGLTLQSDKAVVMYTHQDGLTDNVVLSVFQDREGDVWVGTPRGLERFRKTNLVPVVLPQGYQRFAIAAGDNGTVWVGSQSRGITQIQATGIITPYVDRYVGSAYRDPAGEVWLGGIRDVFRITGAKSLRLELPVPEDMSSVVEAITRDHAGRLWVATQGHGIWTLENDHWQPYKNPALPDSSVTAEYTDAQGRVWFGYASGLVAVLDNGAIHTYSNNDGAFGGVKVIRGRGQDVWIGGEFGIAFLQRGRFQRLSAAGKNPFSQVSGVVETSDGSVWLSEARGVIRVPAGEIEAARHDPSYKVHYQVFDFDDGLPGATQQVATPTAIEGTDGRLWFATVGGLAWTDPNRIQWNSLPPPVYVTSVSTNGNEYTQLANLEFPARTTNVQIAYTALSLAIPERVHFRYKLDGVDQDWQDSGTRRTAFYTNLGPGSHHFQVIASNNDGVWNETGAALDFTIQPAFYQTRWFLALCIASALAVLYLFYLLRVRQVAQRVRGRMQERLDERERIARDLHDTLLQSVQGLILKFQSIAKRIPQHDAIRHDMEKTLDVADEVLQEGRDRVRSLRHDSLSLRDLAAAFRRVAEEAAPDASTTAKTIVEGAVRELHPVVLEESYSIGREALVNAIVHSECRQVEVEITYDPRQFRLRVRDDGRGIDPNILEEGRADHWGLQGMRERANKIGGQLEIWSRPGSGTEVELRVPAATAYRSPRARNTGVRFQKAVGTRTD